MASVASSAEYILPIRGRAIRPATKPQIEATIQWTWGAIADAASSIAFLGTLGWVIWHFGAQLSQMASTGASGLF
jgi:hypothetical protein